MAQKSYIQVILPLRLEWEPCYCLPDDDIFAQRSRSPKVGDRIKVKFARRYYTAVVSKTGAVPDFDPLRIEPITDPDTGLEPISEQEIDLWRFIADYYLCTVGEVYKAAYPLPKVKSEEAGIRVTERQNRLRDKEAELWQNRIAKLCARLAIRDISLAKRHSEPVTARLRGERAALAAEIEAARRRLAAITSREIFTDTAAPAIRAIPGELSGSLSTGKPLLYISGSRVQEYIAAASAFLEKGQSVLLLVPEISLARNLESSLREAFGSLLLVHHSEETTVRRRRISDRVRSGEPYILLGTRSSIFLPFKSLGLIVVDCEQSPFYKQTDSTPRYNGRDCAVILGKIYDSAVLLGSSSPSIESLLNARTGRYSLVRQGNAATQGRFEIVDTRAEKRKNGMLGCLSRKLITAIKEAIKADCGVMVALIRGYEHAEDVRGQLGDIFREFASHIEILTIPESSHRDLTEYGLVAMLSADALFRSDDFRSDERAYQYLDALRTACGNVLVQTANPAHQVFSLKNAEPLMAERRIFNLPPYTRLVDILVPECSRFATLPQQLYRRLIQEGFMASDPMPRQSQSGGEDRMLIRVTFQRTPELSANKKALYSVVQTFRTEHHFRGNIILDVDPA